jgi:hypothetical protein
VIPDGVPVLSRGKHRNSRRGACFMEMASVLAGEAWSDHPQCTHPLLASLARLVNDHTSDERRSELAPLIPAVIGLTSDDPRLDAAIAMRCAQVALPMVSLERQHVLAVALLAANQLLAELDGRPLDEIDERSRKALIDTPEAARWAQRFTEEAGISTSGFRRRTAPLMVSCAVEGIANACIDDPDGQLHDLLATAINDAAAFCALAPPTSPAPAPQRRAVRSPHR